MEAHSTSAAPSSVEAQNLEMPTVETISVVGEDGHPSPADYVLRCRGDKGQIIRYKTHKQALAQGSTFFHDMFAACTPKNEGPKSIPPVKDIDDLDMDEDSFVVFVLIQSMYGGGAALQKSLKKKISDEITSYSR